MAFEAIDAISEILKEDAVRKIRKKMASRLVKKLAIECKGEFDFDLRSATKGVYCIALDEEFEFDYEKRPSRILHIGSGNICTRISSHLEGKLFDFAYDLRVVPFRFYFADLTTSLVEKKNHVALEQSLLAKFSSDTDQSLPLLNKNNASKSLTFGEANSGWDKPLQRDRGPQATAWLLKAKEANHWKGALQ
ncbi:hypothetical protein GIY56_09140 [Paracoccus sp. YIM 132242]|uniref:Uncharacterized protein n=1 Tax=Paracoccus lichenicola TaxID=2665644 RepID=A0A6L6HPY2_9RHOB|nr:hypothetical protein [Paracoccus lichenicola]MTE00452.1 hypothetical protein [Paracoccus lichenicola]